MKKSIILLLLIPCFCFGQKRQNKELQDALKRLDSMGTVTGNTLYLYHDMKTAIRKGDTIYFPNGSPYDTVKIIMLTSDISLQHYNNHDCVNCQHEGYNNFSFWQYGYIIKSCFDCIAPDKYLDAEKKELSPNIVVWMVKNL